jgi:hypothetical protein
MVNFHVEAGSFCSSSKVMFTKCVQNITEKATKPKDVNLRKSGICIQMACIPFIKVVLNNAYSSLIMMFI